MAIKRPQWYLNGPVPTDPDPVPLTEKERATADNLLDFSLLLDEEPTRMVGLTDTSIEMLQHGLVLLKSVQDHRIMNLDESEANYDEDKASRVDTIRNVLQLYTWLEKAKTQKPI